MKINVFCLEALACILIIFIIKLPSNLHGQNKASWT